MIGEVVLFGTVVEKQEVAHSSNYDVFHFIFVVSEKVLELLALLMFCVIATSDRK